MTQSPRSFCVTPEPGDESLSAASPLSELTRSITRLGAPYGLTVGLRLLEGVRGPWLELRAVRHEGDGSQEYARHLSLETLESRQVEVVAAEFIREARTALRCAAEETAADERQRAG